MVDTHAHLDLCEGPPAQLVADAEAAGLVRILTVGIDPGSNREAISIAEQNDSVFVSLGHHPHGASGYSEAVAGEIGELAGHEKVKAIGETGLDFYRELSPPADQERAFISLIELARSNELPLMVHTRSAARETMELLKKYAENVEVIIHCFSIPEFLDECIERGYHCSFAGNITYPKSDELRAACSRVPEKLLLLETDSPYLSPQKMRGRPNTPANVVNTAQLVAEVRGRTYKDIQEVVERNAATLFGW